MIKKFDSQRFLRFSLIFVLVASLRHVAWGFSTLESNTLQCSLLFIPLGPCNTFWGYFQAVAIDLVVVALGYGIEHRKRNGLATGWYWVGVVAFCAVSTYANMLYGLVFSSPVQASTDWPRLSQWMVYAKPFVLSGILPVMLVYISHITASYGQTSATDRLTWPPLETQVNLFVQELGDANITPDEAARKFAELTNQSIATRIFARALASRTETPTARTQANLMRLSAKVDEGAMGEGVQGGGVVQAPDTKSVAIRNGQVSDAPMQSGKPALDTAARRARVREMHATGMSQAEMARRLGCNASTVRRDLDALRREAEAVRGNGKVRERVV